MPFAKQRMHCVKQGDQQKDCIDEQRTIFLYVQIAAAASWLSATPGPRTRTTNKLALYKKVAYTALIKPKRPPNPKITMSGSLTVADAEKV